MHRSDSVCEGSLPPDILSDNNHADLGNPGCCSWAAGFQKQYASLGMTSPLSGADVHDVDHFAFHKAKFAWRICVWEGLAS